MHNACMQPARLKPGVTSDSIAKPASATSAEDATSTAVIRGKALIFWDLKVLGKKKKLDAIDTDQITPAADCVSESLDTLDERWKAGSFRYLMPDFRARVHRGETFVIAGDRFAIGSSREMSPAGLKAIADEVGPRDGDRLRPQHGRHLPAQRAQPRAAGRAEPRGGGRRQGRRRVLVRAAVAPPDQRNAGQDATTRCRSARRKTRSGRPAASSRRGGASSRHRSTWRRGSSGPIRSRRAA